MNQSILDAVTGKPPSRPLIEEYHRSYNAPWIASEQNRNRNDFYVDVNHDPEDYYFKVAGDDFHRTIERNHQRSFMSPGFLIGHSPYVTMKIAADNDDNHLTTHNLTTQALIFYLPDHPEMGHVVLKSYYFREFIKYRMERLQSYSFEVSNKL